MSTNINNWNKYAQEIHHIILEIKYKWKVEVFLLFESVSSGGGGGGGGEQVEQ